MEKRVHFNLQKEEEVEEKAKMTLEHILEEDV